MNPTIHMPLYFGPVEYDSRTITTDENGLSTIVVNNIKFKEFFHDDKAKNIVAGYDKIILRMSGIGDVTADINRVQEFTVGNDKIYTLKLLVRINDTRINAEVIDITPKPIPRIKYKSYLLCSAPFIESEEDCANRRKEFLKKYSTILFDGKLYHVVSGAKAYMVKTSHDFPDERERRILGIASPIIYTTDNSKPISEKDFNTILDIYNTHASNNKFF